MFNYRRKRQRNADVSLFNLVAHLVLEPKGTLGTIIMSDNAPVKVVTVWP